MNTPAGVPCLDASFAVVAPVETRYAATVLPARSLPKASSVGVFTPVATSASVSGSAPATSLRRCTSPLWLLSSMSYESTASVSGAVAAIRVSYPSWNAKPVDFVTRLGGGYTGMVGVKWTRWSSPVSDPCSAL